MDSAYREAASLEELRRQLREEARGQARWPVRFLLVSGRARWRQVLELLQGEVTQIIRLSEFCQGDDTLPHLPPGELAARLTAEPAGRTLLLPVGELLRLHEDLGGGLVRSLATLEQPGWNRVYVPLWQAEDLLARQLRRVSRWQAGELPPVWILAGRSEELQIILTPLPVQAPTGFATLQGLKAYLARWEEGAPAESKILVTTGYAQAARPVVGRVELRVCRRGYEVVQEFLAGADDLQEDWGTAALWDWLAREMLPGGTFPATAARLLNVRQYDFLEMLADWPAWPSEKRWLFWLWGKIQLPGHYAREVLDRSPSWEDVEESCWNGIFQQDIPWTRQILAERRTLLQKMQAGEPPASFWEQYEALTDPLKQLQALTGLSRQERLVAAALVQRLLQEERPRAAILEALETAFPELAWYLAPLPGVDATVGRYFDLYRQARLLDRPTAALCQLAEELAREDYLCRFEARHKILEEKRREAAAEVWLDGCGVEWLGFIEAFCRRHQIVPEIKIARANLPSITAANRDWPDAATPRRDLDILAHSYDYQFPLSLVKALEWLKEQLLEILGRLAEVPAIILTGDHGLTRYRFHQERTIAPPPGAEVDRWGRCARIANVTPEIAASPDWRLEGGYISLKGYGRFQGGAGAVGEVHGGATLEETLVPVLVLRRPGVVAVPSVTLAEPLIRFDIHRTGTLSEVRLDPDPGQVQLRTWDNRVIDGRRLGPGRYAFTLTDLQPGEFRVRFEAQGRVIGEHTVKVASTGITEEDMGI